MKKMLAVVLTLVIVLGAFLLVAEQKGDDTQQSKSAGAHVADVSNSRAAVAATAGQVSLASDAFQIMAQAKTASQAYQVLLARAERGDVAALMAVSHMVGACYYLFDDPKRGPVNDSPPESNTFKLRQDALARRKAFCDDPNSHRIARDQVLTDYQVKLDKSAEDGDELALASRLFLAKEDMGSAGVEVAIEIGMTTKQPEALQDAILALSGSSDPRIMAIEKQVFNDLQSPAERSAVTLRAAEWSACMNGKADCGPYNHEADSDCIYLGECYSHLSRMDYLRTRALSGQQYSQMQRYLQLLNSQVLHRR